MELDTPLHRIRHDQRAWADRSGISIDADGYCRNLRDNLFQDLSAGSRDDFAAGDGQELGKIGARGKMQALHSSSALACNVFDYWRMRDPSSFGQVLSMQGVVSKVSMEQKFPNGVSKYPPNIDVVLGADNDEYVAIESKFTEPFTGARNKNVLKEKYFDVNTQRWTGCGMPGVQHFAESLHSRLTAFELLDAAQLLKHMLGLGKRGGNWRLLYLWFDPSGEQSRKHKVELAQFSNALGSDGNRFFSMTYQELVRQLSEGWATAHMQYLNYLQMRYFPQG